MWEIKIPADSTARLWYVYFQFCYLLLYLKKKIKNIKEIREKRKQSFKTNTRFTLCHNHKEKKNNFHTVIGQALL